LATYRLSVQLISRSSGRSATGAAAYRAGERIRDVRTGEVFDYRRRGDVLDASILAPTDAPEWVHDREPLWNKVESAEKRRDAQVAREIQLSLPYELSFEANKVLLRDFVASECVALGMIADITMHAPHRGGDERNVHAHILLTTRELLADRFGPKARAWNEKAQLERWRAGWETAVNHALDIAKVRARVSHLSYARRGIDREGEPKQGPIATKMERYGRESHAGRDRRAVRARNERRDSFRRRIREIDADIERDELVGRQGKALRDPSSRIDANFLDDISWPSISSPERSRWRSWREAVLSEHYALNLESSNLARFWRIERSLEGLVFSNARGRFVDEGTRITADRTNDLVIRGMLDAAEAHGWRELVISGDDDFKRRTMLAALDRGFDIRAQGRDEELLRELRASGRSERALQPERDLEAEWDR
jgi:hypothetical protein